jgi:DnaK suppressor protein
MANHLTTLLRLRQDLQARQANRDVIQIEHHPDPLDNVYSVTAREAAAGVITQERELLREVEAAIQRCEEGSWGICEACGDEIPAKRLAAVPWAPRCRDCQELAEQEAAAERARTSCGGILE